MESEGGRTEWVVLSDVHLTELVTDRPEGWWAFKDPQCAQDEALSAFLASIERQRPASITRTELIFNGDTFDFDSVFAHPPGVVGHPGGMESSVAGSVFKLRCILGGHRRFVGALAGFLARGGAVTFVLGNHDRELCFAETRELLVQALVSAAPPGTGEQVAARVQFEPWFVRVPGVLYVEHGQQYDGTCSYRDVLWPVIPPDRKHPRVLESSLGSHSGREMLSRLGTFNPYDDDSFLLSLGGYARHYVRHYWRKRPFFRAYVWSALQTYRVVRAQRRRALAGSEAREASREAAYAAYAREKGLEPGDLAALRDLWSPPIADRVGALMHELWLDRWLAGIAFTTLLVAGVYSVERWYHAFFLLALLPIFSHVLRLLGRGSTALIERGRWGLVAERIARRLKVPIVAFGHSHRPERREVGERTRYFNLGTWAPLVPGQGPRADARRYLRIRVSPGGRIGVLFDSWKG